MNVLVDQLRDRYSEYAFSLNKKGPFWELRCYKNYKERWCLFGKKNEIEKEIEFLLS